MVSENTPLRRRNFSTRIQRRYNSYKSHQTIAPGNLTVKRKQRKQKSTNNLTVNVKTFIVTAPKAPKEEATVPVILPRHLVRPAPPKEDVVLPDVDAPPAFVRDTFATHGPHLFRSLSTARTEIEASTSTALPKSVKVTVPVGEERPTHILAAYAPKTTNITLYPVHDIVLAAHLHNYPRQPAPSEPLAEDHVPVQPFCIPHPASYAPLSQYLYIHRQDLLFTSLCAPATAPDFFPSRAHDSDSQPAKITRDQMLAFARELSETFTQHKLLQTISTLHGLYKNMVALSVHDDGLWEVLEVAWGVYLTAVAWRLEGISAGDVLPVFESHES